jgi:hypothetical protein
VLTTKSEKRRKEYMSATAIKKATAAETVAELFPARQSVGKTEAKAAWKVALECFVIVWAVFSVAIAILIIAAYVPGHLGLSDLLQALGNLLPPDFPLVTT